MTANVEGWLKRAEKFQVRDWKGHGGHSTEALMFATSMTAAIYGPASPQMKILEGRVATDDNSSIGLYQIASGAIHNVVAEIEAGLITSIRLGITGEVLADLITMAQEALTENKVEVAAVLTAAAFEDFMRRLAHEKEGVSDRIQLEHVLIAIQE